MYAISYEDLKQLCPDEVAAIENTKEFQEGDKNWGDLADDIGCGHTQELLDWTVDFQSLVKKLQAAFKEATTTPCGSYLELDLIQFNHWEEDDSDVLHHEGCIFEVENTDQTTLTPAAKNIRNMLKYND